MPIALLVFFAAAATALPARPITGPWPGAYPAKDLCSNCGLCNTAVGVEHVADACAFLGDGMARLDALEERVHGRARRLDDAGDRAVVAQQAEVEALLLASRLAATKVGGDRLGIGCRRFGCSLLLGLELGGGHVEEVLEHSCDRCALRMKRSVEQQRRDASKVP